MPRKPTPKKTYNHPKYAAMIGEAIIMLKEKSGSSMPAISKYVQDKFEVPEEDAFKTQLKLALKRGVENETFIKNKASYRLDPAYRAKLKKKLGLSSKKKSSSSRSRSRSPARSKERSKSPAARGRSKSKSKSPSRSTKKKSSSRSKSPAPKKRTQTTSSIAKRKPKPRTTQNSRNAGKEKGTRVQPSRRKSTSKAK